MNKIIVADADALIALAVEKDPHHKNAMLIMDMLTRKTYPIVFPFTVFPEAITTLKRALNMPEKAHLLNRQLGEGVFQIVYPDKDIMNLACKLFEKTVSKKNTLFDAIVLATAKNLHADAIFSFDSWYSKQGFDLIEVGEG